jgi:hypothetical protein
MNSNGVDETQLNRDIFFVSEKTPIENDHTENSTPNSLPGPFKMAKCVSLQIVVCWLSISSSIAQFR